VPRMEIAATQRGCASHIRGHAAQSSLGGPAAEEVHTAQRRGPVVQGTGRAAQMRGHAAQTRRRRCAAQSRGHAAQRRGSAAQTATEQGTCCSDRISNISLQVTHSLAP
jgi:hypothetical protein